jgi:MFS family permease
MFERRIPEWLRHAPAPSVRGFALLGGFEAMARGILVSVFPVAVYNSLQEASLVSRAYFLIGVVSLFAGLLVPWLNRFIPRRFLYASGVLLFMFGAGFGATGISAFVIAGLFMTTLATVITFVCFNAYVLDYIAKIELGRCETLRLFYSALGWTIGPAAGISLYALWKPAPFIISAVATAMLFGAFLYMRLGNGKLIVRAKRPAPNPLAFLGRFVQQPRLVTGWIFAVIRSCGWWVYVVYLPIFAIENGLPEQLGGLLLSLTNAGLLAAPLMLRFVQRYSVRRAVRTGFLLSGFAFMFAAGLADWALASVACLCIGSFFLILLDVSAGLPFLMAVKPSERTEMSAIYSSYRDVSGILTPGVAWMTLMVAPLSTVFAVSGAGLLACFALASRLHPRLGQGRVRAEPT